MRRTQKGSVGTLHVRTAHRQAPPVPVNGLEAAYGAWTCLHYKKEYGTAPIFKFVSTKY